MMPSASEDPKPSVAHMRPLHPSVNEATGGALTMITVLLWVPVAPPSSVTVSVAV